MRMFLGGRCASPPLVVVVVAAALLAVVAVPAGAAAAAAGAAAPPAAGLEDDVDDAFERFVEDYGKSYPSEREYELRRAIFRENVQTIRRHNSISAAAKDKKKKGRHVLGVNYFADHRPDELPMGLDKAMLMSSPRPSLPSSSRISSQDVNKKGEEAPASMSTNRRRSLAEIVSSLKVPFRVEPVEELPDAVDWREEGVTTPVKMQGRCGSCWAFASATALESHVAIRTGTLFQLSPQELVSCAGNPLRCGGGGGCAGATAEIAFEHVREHGMVQEWQFGYQSYHWENVTCSLKRKYPRNGTAAALRGGSIAATGAKNDTFVYQEAIAGILGYVTLGQNNYVEMMNVVAKIGPITVSVAAHDWHLYSKGVFYEPLNSTKSTDIDHLVVLEGYGTDEETGEDYWLVRNSWGPLWGEKGYIRLRRVDPSTLDDPDSDCGMDVTPANGEACTKDKDGIDVTPPPAKVCGTSGVLYWATVPLGAHII